MRTKFNVEIDSGKCLLHFAMIFLYKRVIFTEFKRLILGYLVETAAKRNQVLSLKNIKAIFLTL